MQISAATTTTSSRSIESTASASSTSGKDTEVQDPVAVHRVAGLLAMLENKPDVRPEVVARGRALAANADYPPPDVINKLAGLVVGE